MSEIKLTKAQRLLAIDDFIRWTEHMSNVAYAHGDKEGVNYYAKTLGTADIYQVYELGEFADDECASEAQLEEYRNYRGEFETLCAESDELSTYKKAVSEMAGMIKAREYVGHPMMWSDVDALDDLHSQILTIHNEIIAAKPSLLNVTISRQRFETWWQQEMNTEAMPLTRTEYPMVKDEDQQYLCHDTNRGWLTWQANDETNAADTLDAKRYRWLADGSIDTYSLFVEAENKAQLDAAIDESMAECWEAQNKESK